MRDKELQMLAAKAAGYAIEWCADWPGGGCFMNPVVPEPVDQGLSKRVPWAPIDDDGDALRLAADLRLKVLPGRLPGDGCTVESQRQGIPGCTTFRDDKREQMRRAIVHVAAEIGKAMP
ncbi:hypothetical protein [Delftia acidovorans]|uniref:hypothetical protein n=1 Tax=Delftia acidovorans TaxID=80866 RepID=UPI003D13B98E